MFISNSSRIILLLMQKTQTYCFRCKQIREIIDPKDGVTKNNRKIRRGRCIECDGRIALMGGYATLPENDYIKTDDNNYG